MREVLEQVKQEFGEDALILDTKNVRAGGFLGIGSSEQVEVRVAADQTPRGGRTTPSSDVRSALYPPGEAVARSAEDTVAISSRRTPTPSRPPASPVVPPRAAAETNGDRTASSSKSGEPPELIFRGIEIADTAPRFVHRNPASPIPSLPPTAVGSSDPSTAPRNPVTSELERLRAELREVKFYLGSLANRPAAIEAATEQEATVQPKRNGRGRKEVDSELHQSPGWEVYLELTAAGVASELARRAALTVPEKSETNNVNATGRAALAGLLASIVSFADDPPSIITNTVEATPQPMVFIGPTGVGKTTTIAKLAARITLRARRRVELITLDTHRIAAAEQLKTYAEVIGAGFHVARSALELDALLRRLTGDATVLIDTVGRSPHDVADQMELADYLRANTGMHKSLVLQAVTHPADARAAAKKFALYGANRLVITKLDETIRPGAAVQIATDAELPLLYLCAGQRVPEDLEQATPASLAARVLRAPFVAAAAA